MRTVIPPEARVVPPNAKLAFKGIMYDVYHWPQQLFDGSTATFEMLRRLDTVRVVAVHDDRIILIDDEQPTHKKHPTFPGGRHDVEAETELDCAKRELLEETGMRFKDWKLLGVRQVNSEIDWLVYVFLASGFQDMQAPKAGPGERIAVRSLPYEEIVALKGVYPTTAYALDFIKQAGSIDGLLTIPEYK